MADARDVAVRKARRPSKSAGSVLSSTTRAVIARERTFFPMLRKRGRGRRIDFFPRYRASELRLHDLRSERIGDRLVPEAHAENQGVLPRNAGSLPRKCPRLQGGPAPEKRSGARVQLFNFRDARFLAAEDGHRFLGEPADGLVDVVCKES